MNPPSSVGNAAPVLIVGASSAIAEAVARRYAEDGRDLLLVRRSAANQDDIDALRRAGARNVTVITGDYVSAAGIARIVSKIDQLQPLSHALVAFGTMPDQEALVGSERALQDLMAVNVRAPMLWCDILAPKMATGGTLAVISSVAGERGRASNLYYGASKAALSTYLSGKAQQQYPRLRILDIRPGVVSSPMTLASGMPRTALWAEPDEVAGPIFSAMHSGGPIVRVPWRWNVIMAVVRNLPWFLFRRARF